MKKNYLFIFLFFVTKVTFAQFNINDGLIGKYYFSGNANDTSDLENDGIASGVELTNDRFGNEQSAFIFSENSEISLDGTKLNVEEFTWSAWVKPSQLPGSNELYSIISIGNDGADQTLAIANSYGPGLTGFSVISYHSTEEFEAYSTGEIPIVDEWYHLVFLRSKSKIELYVNGELSLSYPTVNSPKYNNPVQAKIGQRSHIGGFSFYGIIDDISLYNKPLTSCEIDILKTSNHDKMLTYYPFTGNAKDSSGNGNNGIVNGAFLTSDINGTNDAAYYFDGNSDINIDATDLTNPEFTFSAWVNISQLPVNESLQSIISIGNVGSDQVLAVANNYSFGYTGFAIVSYNDIDSFDAFSTGELPQENSWYHLAFIRTANQIKLYVNGELLISENTNFSVNYSLPALALIGGRQSGGNFNFVGKIDEVRIFNEGLSVCEVNYLYESHLKDNTITNIQKTSQFTSNFNLYPNPVSSDEVHFIFSNETVLQAYLFSQNGTVISQGQVNNNSIIFGKQEPGMYFLKVNTEQGPKIEKVIIK